MLPFIIEFNVRMDKPILLVTFAFVANDENSKRNYTFHYCGNGNNVCEFFVLAFYENSS